MSRFSQASQSEGFICSPARIAFLDEAVTIEKYIETLSVAEGITRRASRFRGSNITIWRLSRNTLEAYKR